MEARSGKNNQTGKVLATTKTDGKGQYALSLPKGDFTLTVKKKDFRNYYALVSVSGNKTQTLPVIKSSAPLYKLNAIVSDAENGKMLKNASVQVRSGKNNKTGYVIATAKSSSKGKFNLPIYKGNYTLAVALNNYITLYCNVNLSGNNTISLPLSKKLSSSQYRAVLSWGKSPADLDLHATGPKSSSGYSRFNPRVGIFHHDAFLRQAGNHFRRLQKHFRMRFGMRNAVSVRHRVKEAVQADPFQDEGCVLAGGTDCQLQAGFPQPDQRHLHVIRQIRRRHPGQQVPVHVVLFLCQDGFFLL